ncbi:DUF2971 domain-containing protein [Ralstonia pseudosolanacearum]|uniref:DUF2971 domain-containing protein n=1 Tax=Ralstonia pseudosolanacearum TaxID=1310165 RepID=UPI00267510A9|nr:DUF2971 domain-containing protein [Ralstonia pseudosolanacearum]MDO3510226.1 DUF2971 domain-containing protein [Ralstonia pseudosolanacearum]MDO3619400.1 DUF2971 domain-containing protein [Ralstonia pseudosolanacearum]
MKYLYRIQSFDRVVEIFERKELYLAHPSSWEDPYESRLKHEASNALFAQCWSINPQSDAMWRIYSPDRLGLRVKSTRENLRAAIREGLKKDGLKYRLGDVEYLPQKELNQRLLDLAETLKESFTPATAANSLQWKRRAFEHEREVRLIAYRKEVSANPQSGLRIKIDPHELIDDILIDPRAPSEFVDAFKFYLKNKIGFQGEVGRSLLYAEQKPIEVDPLDPAADL